MQRVQPLACVVVTLPPDPLLAPLLPPCCSKPVAFPPRLKMKRTWLAADSGERGGSGAEYELVSTVTHHGKTIGSGHYTADVLQPGDKCVARVSVCLCGALHGLIQCASHAAFLANPPLECFALMDPPLAGGCVSTTGMCRLSLSKRCSPLGPTCCSTSACSHPPNHDPAATRSSATVLTHTPPALFAAAVHMHHVLFSAAHMCAFCSSLPQH